MKLKKMEYLFSIFLLIGFNLQDLWKKKLFHQKKASDKYKVVLIDIEEGGDIAIKNGFSSYPVTQIYKDNALMFNTIGFEKEESLSSKLRELF